METIRESREGDFLPLEAGIRRLLKTEQPEKRV
jgi:hypothetical protein